MTKDALEKNESQSENKIGKVLKDLFDSLSKGAQELSGYLNPQPRPALQPVPVRRPVSRRMRIVP